MSRRRLSIERAAAKRRAHLDDVVEQMHAAYMTGLSLAEVGRRHGGRSHKAVRGLFVVRGLFLRPTRGGRVHLENGRFKPAAALSAREIDGIIAGMKKLNVPEAIAREWRSWPLERRGEFIRRVRAKLQSPEERPATPFSKNVEPFDYTTPRARAIAAEINKHCASSRHWKVKIDLRSQGVIYRGALWFWSVKAYARGPWNPERGRPVLHHVIWEETHGRKVPRGQVVRFADGNRNNHDPRNLVLVTRNELCRENQARSLFKKARETTALLLNRHHQPRKEKAHGLLETLNA